MAKKSKKYAEISPETLEALREYADEHGPEWRRRLSAQWMNASAPPLLHRLRNTHGPKWLAEFEFPKSNPSKTKKGKKIDPDLLAWVEEMLQRPGSFGYSGDQEGMFQTWSLGPAILTRDSDVLEKANAIALQHHLEELAKKDKSLKGEWEITHASHWAVGWVDHLSFHAIDDAGRPTKIAAILKKWFDALKDYPVADENLLSEMEAEERDEDWENWYAREFRRALEKLYDIEEVDSDEFIDNDTLYRVFREADVTGEGMDIRADEMAKRAVKAISRNIEFREYFDQLVAAEQRARKSNPGKGKKRSRNPGTHTLNPRDY